MVKKMMVVVLIMIMLVADASTDTNNVFDPYSDTKIQRRDGFIFGLAFSTKETFFFNRTQLSPCDSRLSLSGSNAQVAVFRPKVDEVSLLSINGTTFNPIQYNFFHLPSVLVIILASEICTLVINKRVSVSDEI